MYTSKSVIRVGVIGVVLLCAGLCMVLGSNGEERWFVGAIVLPVFIVPLQRVRGQDTWKVFAIFRGMEETY
jgi:hypothetical protein